LLLVGELLITKHQDGVLIHSGMNVSDFVRRKRLPAIDAGDLVGEDVRELSDRYS